MKLPRLITRRRVKWVGVVLCVFVLGVYIGSAWYVVRWYVVNRPSSEAIIAVGEGGLSFGVVHFDTLEDKEGRRSQRVHFSSFGGPSIILWPKRLTARGGTGGLNGVPVTFSVAYLPLWVPLLLIAVPTAYLWHTDRRAKPWQCAKCRYDLRGLDGGVCPECGGAVRVQGTAQ